MILSNRINEIRNQIPVLEASIDSVLKRAESYALPEELVKNLRESKGLLVDAETKFYNAYRKELDQEVFEGGV